MSSANPHTAREQTAFHIRRDARYALDSVEKQQELPDTPTKPAAVAAAWRFIQWCADTNTELLTDPQPIAPEQRYPGDRRVMSGLTQPQAAARAQLSTAILQRIERGEYPLSDKSAEALAEVLGISADEYHAAYQRARQRPAGAPS